MARSKNKKRKCDCGQAHVVAVFDRDSYDEWAVPIEVHAFASCDEWHDWIDNLSEEYQTRCFAEGMSSHVIHHATWMERFKERFKS